MLVSQPNTTRLGEEEVIANVEGDRGQGGRSRGSSFLTARAARNLKSQLQLRRRRRWCTRAGPGEGRRRRMMRCEEGLPEGCGRRGIVGREEVEGG